MVKILPANIRLGCKCSCSFLKNTTQKTFFKIGLCFKVSERDVIDAHSNIGFDVIDVVLIKAEEVGVAPFETIFNDEKILLSERTILETYSFCHFISQFQEQHSNH